ncbi:MAG: hypothetical protein WBM83_06900 [Flavobacteriaceae bacterium]
MNRISVSIVFFAWLSLVSLNTYAQEDPPEINLEPSAEVFLEDYSDEFEEQFFEALKQKGIENYDKAINLLLACKQLDADNSVVDHELAKAYYEDRQYVAAQDYAVEALSAEPANLWYLNTLVTVLENQESTIEGVASKIPMANTKLNENLALIYFKKGEYEAALALLKSIQSSSFTKELSSKINDSISNKEAQSDEVSFSETNEGLSDDFESYKVQLEDFIRTNNIASLGQLASEALESYPSQPFFYYAKGFAFHKEGKPKEAIELLETALDYLVDDLPLANKIYKELSDAYTAVNNTSKANMYLRKIKPGF